MRLSFFVSIFLAVLVFSGEAAAGKTSYSTSSTMTYNGVTYNYSSTSTCPDGTAALRYQRKWWCPATTTTATAPTSTTTSSTTTTTTTTTSPTTTTTTVSTAPVVYAAQLSWSIPATRADGTALSASELAGYEVYYTNDSGSVAATVPVSGGTTTAASVSSLSSGNYSFAISAIDTTGLKSALSSVVAVSFP